MPLSSSTKEEIKKRIKGEVLDDQAALDKASRDASLFRLVPELVVAPRDVEDVKELVRFVVEKNKVRDETGERVALTARSAGTDMSGGPLTESIVVDFLKHFNHIKEIKDGVGVTEPGVYYRDFEKETLKQDLIFPSYPASRELCTVGGIAANNAGGEKTLTYGKTAHYVENIRAVLDDGNEYIFHPITLEELEDKKSHDTREGELYRGMHKLIEDNYDRIQAARPKVSKNSAGYALWDVLDRAHGTFDLSKVLVGSQGTLGLMTEISFKLVHPKKHSRMLVIFLKNENMPVLGSLINKVLAFRPESFESYDDHTFRIALKAFPMIVKRLRGNIISLGFKFLPEFWAALVGGIPKLVLLAEFTADSDEEAYAKALEAAAGIESSKLSSRVLESAKEAEKYWVVRRESFNILRQRVKNLRTACFIDDIIVKPEDLPEFLPRLYELLDSYSFMIYTVAGHMGDANFHIIPLVDMQKPETKDMIFEVMDKVNKLVLEYHGSFTAEHNDGLLRTPYLADMFGSEVAALFAETKRIFDPGNIFNPGKKVGTDEAFMKSHVDMNK